MGLDNKEPGTSTFDANESNGCFPAVPKPKPKNNPHIEDTASVDEAIQAEDPRIISSPQEIEKIDKLSRDTRDASEKSRKT